MNGTLMSTTQMLNSISQLLNYSTSLNHNESNKNACATSLIDEHYADEQVPSTSAADTDTAASSLTNYLHANGTRSDRTQSDHLGKCQRRRLRRERVHPVSAYFLVTDEKSKCAICILCFNVMKASKTANLMRHMSRYHKLVAADLERQWDLIKGSKLKYRARDDATLASVPLASDFMPGSPLNNESSDNGSPFLGPEPNLADGVSRVIGNEQKVMSAAEADCEAGRCAITVSGRSVRGDSVTHLARAAATMPIQDLTGKETNESYDAYIQHATSGMTHTEDMDTGASTSVVSSCPSCVKRTTDTALLVTLLKRQDQLHKRTERLLEEHAEREKLFQEKQEEFWKRADALLKTQEEQQRMVYDLTVKMGTLIERFSLQHST